MKKYILILALSFTTFFSFAELYPAKRIVEVGVDSEVGLSQNLASVTDFLVDELVIDFCKIADSFSDEGFITNLNFAADAFVNLNFGSKFSTGISAGVSGYTNFGIGKEFFNFLAYGTDADNGSLLSSKVSLEMDLSAEISATIKLGFGRLRVRTTPTVYMPLVYMPYSAVSLNVINDEENLIAVKGDADFSVYSTIPTSKLFDQEFNFIGQDYLESLGSNIWNTLYDFWQSSGFSVGVLAEYSIFKTLDVGIFADVPIMPAKLKYKASLTAGVNFESGSLSDLMNSASESGNGSGTESVNPNETENTNSIEEGSASTSTSGDSEFYYYELGAPAEVEPYNVFRPLRINVQAAWRPFGKWFTLRPMFGIAARNPFGEDFDFKTSFFAEYGFSCNMELLYLLHLNVYTEYVNKVFTTGFGIGLNIRAVQVNANIYSSGTDFQSSLQIGGLKASVGVRAGI